MVKPSRGLRLEIFLVRTADTGAAERLHLASEGRFGRG